MDPDELTGPPTKGGGEGSGRGRVLHPAPPRVAGASPHRDPGGPARRSRTRVRMDRRAIIAVSLCSSGGRPPVREDEMALGGPATRPGVHPPVPAGSPRPAA